MALTRLLDVDVEVQAGSLDLRASLQADAGDVVALVGPNGSGKSTLLRAVAAQRPGEVGLVFQDRLLFPHLNALDNVAFGLRRAGLGKSEARGQAQGWLDDVGVGHVAGLRPHALSGGQAQRVALARALARRPAVLLLDEPFAGVDVSAVADVRHAVRTVAAAPNRVCVLVTHQPVDVLALATKVVVLEAGRVVQAGSVADVRNRPRSAWSARMAGVNLLAGQAESGGLRVGAVVVAAVAAAATAGLDGRAAFAVFHPRAVTLSAERPLTSARNAWPGQVADVDMEGDRARVRWVGPVELVAEVTPGAVAEMGLRPGLPVWASVKATEIDLYPA
ncbi:MAG: molybdate transport system ATP-binding protein [Acidimicrobiaceae bacterium]|nr:molybdate transport system ATP-binding protein [Acidimicrobiaceae bacterium]